MPIFEQLVELNGSINKSKIWLAFTVTPWVTRQFQYEGVDREFKSLGTPGLRFIRFRKFATCQLKTLLMRESARTLLKQSRISLALLIHFSRHAHDFYAKAFTLILKALHLPCFVVRDSVQRGRK